MAEWLRAEETALRLPTLEAMTSLPAETGRALPPEEFPANDPHRLRTEKAREDVAQLCESLREIHHELVNSRGDDVLAGKVRHAIRALK